MNVQHRYVWKLGSMSGVGYVQDGGQLTAKWKGGAVRCSAADLAVKVERGAKLTHLAADCEGCR